MLDNLKKDLQILANKENAEFVSRYFKSGKGEYGEGDIFIGVTVPNSRIIAKAYRDLPLSEVQNLLSSKIHEERQVALMILSIKTENADEKELKKLHEFYLENLKYVNNWDLVDGSAENLVGKILREHPNNKVTFKGRTLQGTKLLKYLAISDILWERRIAIVSTFEFIKNNQFGETLKISKILFADNHDLIHKAVGWMLREVGKKDQKTLEKFLKEKYSSLPRTTLRYAIERYPQALRLKYLKGNISDIV